MNTKNIPSITLCFLIVISSIFPISLLVLIAHGFRLPDTDFNGIWSFGRFTLERSSAGIYDTRLLYAFQDLIGNGFKVTHYPFPYAPWILLLLKPLALMNEPVALAVWLILTGCAYLTVLTYARVPAPLILLGAIAPSSLLCVVSGQNGFLSAAFFMGGILLIDRHPRVAGIYLGMLAYKPQLFVAVPVFLIFRGAVSTIVSGCITVFLMTILTVIVFGVDIWSAWIGQLHDEAAALSIDSGRRLHMMPGSTSFMLLNGLSIHLVKYAQLLIGILGSAIIWRIRRAHSAYAAAILSLVTIIATPYSFLYDLPLVTGSVLLLMGEEWRQKKPVAVGHLWIYAVVILGPVSYFSRNSEFSITVMPFYVISLLSIFLWNNKLIEYNYKNEQII